MKNNKMVSLVLALLLLSSCQAGGVSSDSVSTSTDSTSQSADEYEAPARGDETQIYQKRAFPKLTMGSTFYVEDYIGVVPGKSESDTATSFSTYVLTGENDSAIGALENSTPSSNKIILYRTGTLIFNISANGVLKTFTAEVEESNEFAKLMAAIPAYAKNYRATSFSYDDDGKEVTNSDIYRSNNYIYDAKSGTGYVLSKGDDNIYSFTLTSTTSTDLVVNNVPAGDKTTYVTIMGDYSVLSDAKHWSYSPLFNATALLRKYKYCFYYSLSQAAKLFYGLGLMASSYSYNNTKYYPYALYASYQNDTLEVLPVCISSDYSNIVYFSPYRFSMPGEVKIGVLDQYVADYSTPERVDTSEIVTNLRYLTSIMNYTISDNITITDSTGRTLSPDDAVDNVYLTNSSFFQPFYRYIGQRKITEDAYYSKYWTGTSAATSVAGGYWSTGNATYYYKWTGDKYEATHEVIEYGQTAPYAHWYYYSNLQYYIPTAVMAMGDIAKSYPTYDAETGTYEFDYNVGEADSVIKGFVTVGYRHDSVSGGNAKFTTALKQSGKMTMKFEYDSKGVVSKIVITLTMDLTPEIITSLTQDYHWKDVITISDIGTTDVSEITDTLTVPTEG